MSLLDDHACDGRADFFMDCLTDSDEMPWGKHRGERLCEVPDSYLKWLWEETDLKDSVKSPTERGALARYVQSAYRLITE